mgnify:CR=1 FL=1
MKPPTAPCPDFSPHRMPTVSRLSSLLLAVCIASCVHPGTPAERQEKARLLSHDLQQLSPTVSAGEADRLATTAIEETAKLSADFKPFVHPWMNNGLDSAALLIRIWTPPANRRLDPACRRHR